jgi:hypothetical protein
MDITKNKHYFYQAIMNVHHRFRQFREIVDQEEQEIMISLAKEEKERAIIAGFFNRLRKEDDEDKRLRIEQYDEDDDEEQVHMACSPEPAKNLCKQKEKWLLDSGATCHVTNDPKYIHGIQQETKSIIVANGESISAMGVGTAVLYSADRNCKLQ